MRASLGVDRPQIAPQTQDHAADASHPRIYSVQRSKSALSSTQQASSDPGPQSATGRTAQTSLTERRCALAPVCVIAYGPTALRFIAALVRELLRKAHPPGFSQAGRGRGRLQYARGVKFKLSYKPGTTNATASHKYGYRVIQKVAINTCIRAVVQADPSRVLPSPPHLPAAEHLLMLSPYLLLKPYLMLSP